MYEFKLTSKQTESLNYFTNNEIKNLMLYGGSRAAKTFMICYVIFVRAAKVKSRHAILRAKFNHAKRSIFLDTIPKMLNIAMPDLGAKPNKSDYYYTLPNGSEIWIGGLDSKERTEKILGTEYSTMFFNETSQIDFNSISIARTRLAEKNDLVKKAFYDSNPPTKSSWQYFVFEKKINPIDNEPLENPSEYSSFLMNPIDNLENIDEEYIKLLESMPEADRNRFLHGLYSDESDGQVYYAFRREDHVKEVKQDFGSLFIGLDFNVNPMTATILQVVNGKYHIIDEIFLENSDTYKMVDKLKEKKYIGTIIPDSTGANRRTSGKSDHQILKEAGFKIPSVRNPFVTDRVNNVNRLFTDNRIIIDPKCKKLITDLEKVCWKNNELDKKSDPMLTHISDALGYALWHLDPIGYNTNKIDIKTYR
jgi:PBSX family phage terminase large subunit